MLSDAAEVLPDPAAVDSGPFNLCAVAGHPVGDLTRDDVLDNVTFYWLTNTGVSLGRLYWENPYGFFDVKNVSTLRAAFRSRR
jgi:hypothetical protein